MDFRDLHGGLLQWLDLWLGAALVYDARRMWAGPAANGVRQRVALVIAAAVTAVLIAVVIFGSRGLLHLRALSKEQADLGKRIALLLHENEHLRERIHRLRTDDRTLERLAREQLGFTRPGEVIYRFGNRPNPAADAAP